MRGVFEINLRVYPQKEHTRILESIFEVWTRINCSYLRAHPETPLLYRSGVRYRREDTPRALDGKRAVLENWKDIPTILADGYDDCEGLSAWLAAELRCRRGMDTAVVRLIKQPTRSGRRLWHAVVIDLATGRKWDPSKRLGMRPRAVEGEVLWV